jgi:UDP-N-acetylglucosamine acyltransferase
LSTLIHPTSIISDSAHLGENVSIGPYCVIESDTVIGNNTTLHSHVILGKGAVLGANVKVFPGASIGLAPQDLKYDDEPTKAIIGDGTVIREYATANRGTSASGRTIVGKDCLLMSYVHVAHDCVLGDHVIMANSVNLGGHVNVDDWAIIGGLTGVHQFSRIGQHSMIAACSRIAQDVPPFTLCGREPLVVEALNVIGLRRRGFSAADITEIDAFYEALYHSGRNVSQAIAAYVDEHESISDHVRSAIDFIKASKRGICRVYATRSK